MGDIYSLSYAYGLAPFKRSTDALKVFITDSSMILVYLLWILTAYNHIGKRSESDLRDLTPMTTQATRYPPINLIDTNPVDKLAVTQWNVQPTILLSMSGF